MNTISEKILNIKEMVNGLKLDKTDEQLVILKSIVEVLDEISESAEETQEVVDELLEQVDIIDEDLTDLVEDFIELEEAFYDEYVEENDIDSSVLDFEDEFNFDGEDIYYEVTCPTCGEDICFEEEVLLFGETECPNCGEKLEFDFSDIQEQLLADGCECGDENNCAPECSCGCQDDKKEEKE